MTWKDTQSSALALSSCSYHNFMSKLVTQQACATSCLGAVALLHFLPGPQACLPYLHTCLCSSRTQHLELSADNALLQQVLCSTTHFQAAPAKPPLNPGTPPPRAQSAPPLPQTPWPTSSNRARAISPAVPQLLLLLAVLAETDLPTSPHLTAPSPSGCHLSSRLRYLFLQGLLKCILEVLLSLLLIATRTAQPFIWHNRPGLPGIILGCSLN